MNLPKNMFKHSLSIWDYLQELDCWQSFCCQNLTRDMRRDMGVEFITCLFAPSPSRSYCPFFVFVRGKGGCQLSIMEQFVSFFTVHNVKCFKYWKAKSNKKNLYFCCWCRVINNLITSTVQSLLENLKPQPTILTSLSLGQYSKASVWDFPVTTSLSVIKLLVMNVRLVFSLKNKL